jgi:hypothetical protein
MECIDSIFEDGIRKIDYKAGLQKPEWDLHDFVCYVTNDSPYYKSFDSEIYQECFRYKKLDKSNSRLYQLAIRDIKNGKLKPYNLKESYSPYSSVYAPYGTDFYFLAPRTLLEWAYSSHKEIICSELMKYLDYTYWLSQYNWSFNEAVTLLSSKECPFPHEIFNTFDNERTHALANSCKEIFKDIDLDSDIPWERNIVQVITCAKNAGIDYPHELDMCEQIQDKLIEQEKYERTIKVNGWKSEFKLHVNYPSSSITEMLVLLLELRLSDGDIDQPSSYGYKMGGHLHEFLKRALPIEGSVPIIKKDNNTYGNSLVEPKVFLKWCLDNKAPLAKNVKELVIEILGNFSENNKAIENKLFDDDWPDKGLKPSRKHKERCRALASYFWKQTPDTSLTNMANKPDMKKYGCEGTKYTPRIMQNWIRDLNPNKNEELEEIEKNKVSFA